ncbi:MAG: prepilin-type N-terminal cleavage/methylation domain-containing protein [Bryobacteraceae bacterium]
MSRERGFTLIEVVIAVTLVALISLGLLMAMRV